MITEILLESSFDADGLEREKGVVIEELKSQLDDPEDYVFELLFQALLEPHPFSYPISGREASLKLLSREKITDFYKNFLAQRFVVAIAGNFDLDSLVSRIGSQIRGQPFKSLPRAVPSINRSIFKVQKRSEISQVYVGLGQGAVPYKNLERFPLAIFNTAFGGAMSSRLFQSMREKEGLVYNVQSLTELYEDCGLFGIYFVTDKDKLQRCFEILASVFKSARDQGFQKEEIETARSYIKGNLLLSLENSTTRMMRIGRNEVLTGQLEPIETTLKYIDSVDLEQVNSLIKKYINPQDTCLAAVGPIEEEKIRDLWNNIVLKV